MTFVKERLNLKKIAIGIAAISLMAGTAFAIGTASPVSAATETIAYGASWSHGTYPGGWGWGAGVGKVVYSNLASSTRWKHTTAVISTVSNYSGNQESGVTAYAKQGTPYPWDTGYAYCDIW